MRKYSRFYGSTFFYLSMKITVIIILIVHDSHTSTRFVVDF